MKRFTLLLGVMAIFLMMAAPALAQPQAGTRVNVSQKGSLIVWPHVEIKWDAGGVLIQDTFLALTNDLASSGVQIKLYFVNGDDPVPLYGPMAGSVEPGCNFLDNLIDLTHDEPTYWSALTGLPAGVSPFTALDPLGRPDPDPNNPGGTMLRGFVVGFAVSGPMLVRHNHLVGSATVVDYQNHAAYEYQAWAFKANFSSPMSETTLQLDGGMYDTCPEFLLLDFFASGSAAFGPDMLGADSSVDTCLTLLPMILDFSGAMAGQEPLLTSADVDVWNEDEVKFTNLDRCISCWDSEWLSEYALVPNHFLIGLLGTDKGKARISGQANPVCDRMPDPNSSPPDPGRESVDAPLIGVAAKAIWWGAADVGRAAMSLSVMGYDVTGTIGYAPQGDPPESKTGPSFSGQIDRSHR